MSKQSKSLGIDASHTPDKGWLISIISSFNPQCEIFKKSYLPPPRVEKAENKAKVSLPADFLEGLPVSKKKRREKREEKSNLLSKYEFFVSLMTKFTKS